MKVDQFSEKNFTPIKDLVSDKKRLYIIVATIIIVLFFGLSAATLYTLRTRSSTKSKYYKKLIPTELKHPSEAKSSNQSLQIPDDTVFTKRNFSSNEKLLGEIEYPGDVKDLSDTDLVGFNCTDEYDINNSYEELKFKYTNEYGTSIGDNHPISQLPDKNLAIILEQNREKYEYGRIKLCYTEDAKAFVYFFDYSDNHDMRLLFGKIDGFNITQEKELLNSEAPPPPRTVIDDKDSLYIEKIVALTKEGELFFISENYKGNGAGEFGGRRSMNSINIDTLEIKNYTVCYANGYFDYGNSNSHEYTGPRPIPRVYRSLSCKFPGSFSQENINQIAGSMKPQTLWIFNEYQKKNNSIELSSVSSLAPSLYVATFRVYDTSGTEILMEGPILLIGTNNDYWETAYGLEDSGRDNNLYCDWIKQSDLSEIARIRLGHGVCDSD